MMSVPSICPPLEREKMDEQLLIPGIPEKERGERFVPVKTGGKLTKKQDRLAYFYARSGRRAWSAIQAGYSQKNAGKIANQELQKNQVIEAVKYYEKEYLAELDFTPVSLLATLAKINKADKRKIYNEDGSIKNPTEWDDPEALAVVGLKVNELFTGKGEKKELAGYVKDVKMVDPLRAIELGMKHFGLLKENIVYPDKDGNPMLPGVQIQNRIEVVFVNAPGPGEAKNVWQESESKVIEGQEIKGD
jgi:phage terminase small subunit